jgi:acyl dehydratase
MTIAHLLHQGPVLAALGRVALAAARKPPAAKPDLTAGPGAWVEAEVAPRSPKLVEAYLRAVGGSSKAWKGQLPPHLFPQWGFPLLSRTLGELPYPLARVLNQGCRIEVNGPLPTNEPLVLRARLEAVTETETKARIHQVLETGTASSPRALVCHVYAVVPLAKRKGKGPGRVPAMVPTDARELRRLKLDIRAGWRFATVTGDLNPIHWVPAAARAAGFKNCILHGFATLAYAVEAVIAERWSGDVRALAAVDVRFTRPLVLPARLGVFLGKQTTDPDTSSTAAAITVGPGPGGLAVMTGTIHSRSS